MRREQSADASSPTAKIFSTPAPTPMAWSTALIGKTGEAFILYDATESEVRSLALDKQRAICTPRPVMPTELESKLSAEHERFHRARRVIPKIPMRCGQSHFPRQPPDVAKTTGAPHARAWRARPDPAQRTSQFPAHSPTKSPANSAGNSAANLSASRAMSLMDDPGDAPDPNRPR